MKAREVQLPDPIDSPRLVRATVCGTVYRLRLPSFASLMKTFNALGTDALSRSLGTMVRVQEGLGPLDMLFTLQHVGPDLVGIMGTVIGQSWIDPVYQLETPPLVRTPEGIMAYGEAVCEELYEAGWEISDTYGVVKVLSGQINKQVQAINEQLQVEQGVDELLPFSESRRATSSAGGSTSSATSSGPTPPEGDA